MRDAKQNKGFNETLNKYRFNRIKEYFNGKTCLEVGCGEGQMTNLLIKHFKHVTALDGDKKIMKQIKDNQKLTKIVSSIEDVELDTFDTIVCTNFIEHVDNPQQVLDILKQFGHNKTVYIFSTPNAYSYNRTIGVELGMLDTPTTLHEGDIKAGHKRVYTPIEFANELTDAGFYKLVYKSMFYKPLANSDMTKLPKKLIDKLLKQDPIHSGAELFSVCLKGDLL